MGSNIVYSVKDGHSKLWRGEGGCQSDRWLGKELVLVRNAAANLGGGSKACPIVSECRDAGEGVAQGDLKSAAANAALLAFYLLPHAGEAVNAELKVGFKTTSSS